MILLSSTGSAKFHRLALRDPAWYGFLVTPRTRGLRASVKHGATWGMDNDAFSGFDPDRFLEQLDRYRPYLPACRFATCPDTVADHAATLQQWEIWAPQIRALGYPVAFAAQDGCTMDTVPWSEMDALFIGGSDTFKDTESRPLILEANRRGLWVHVGRANTPRRWRYCAELGVDSFDGNTFTRAPDKELAYYQRWRAAYDQQRRLL